MQTAVAVLFSVTGLLAAAYLYGANLRTRWKLRHIPGPSPRWLFGNLLNVPFGQFHTLALILPRKYGPVTKLFLGPDALLLITDPELNKEVAVKQFANFRNRVPPSGWSVNREAAERRRANMIWATDKYWSGLRAACEPLFHSQCLSAYAPLIHNAITGLLHSLELAQKSGEPIEIYSEFGKMSLEAIGTSAFGVHFDTQQPDSPLVDAMKLILTPPAGSILQLLSILVPELRRFWGTLMAGKGSRMQVIMEKTGFLTGTTSVLLENCRRDAAKTAAAGQGDQDGAQLPEHPSSLADSKMQDNSKSVGKKPWETGPLPTRRGGAEGAQRYAHTVPGPNSVFQKLLGAIDKATGQPLSDTQIAANASVLILAGYDTTAIGLSWTIYHLASRPAIQAQIIAEVDAFGQQQPGIDDVAAFPFTQACFREAMRMNPPVNPLIPQVRQAERDVVLGGYRIPKGTVVVMNALGQHMDQRHFPEPEVYRPERFLKGSPDGPDSRHPFAELSFGAGPHKCLGIRFAMEEAVFALVRLFQKYTFRLSAEHHKGGPVLTKDSITLPPAAGIWVYAQLRACSSAL